jgi:Leucine-rich repeat (LRR) protein
LKPSFAFLCELYIDNNLLVSLNGIQQFQNLEVLSFNFNHIELFGELYKVGNKFFMKKLSFIGNPL